MLLLAFAWSASRAPQKADFSTDAGPLAAIPATTLRRADRPFADAGSDLQASESPQPVDAVVEGRIIVLPSWSPARTTITLESERQLQQTIVSNDAGVFSTRLAPGSWRIVRTEEDYAPASAEAALFVSDGENTAGVLLALIPNKLIEGIVVDDDDHPIANAEIGDVLSDAQGKSRLRGDLSRLHVSHPCCEPGYSWSEEDDLRIRLSRWKTPTVGSIFGEVVDGEGRPCEAWVGLVAQRDVSVKTSRAGTFVLPLFARTARVFAEAGIARSESRELRDGDRARLVLECEDATVEVTGRLVDQHGTPWTSCSMQLMAGEPHWFGSGNGRFSLRVPSSAKRSLLRFNCSGNNDHVAALVGPGDADSELGDLVLKRSDKALDGVVINRETRKGIAFALISDGSDFVVTTNEGGAFSLSLDPRRRELRVSAPGFLPRVVPLAESAMSLTIDLAPEVFDAGMSEEYEGVGLRWAAVDAGSGLIVEWLHSTGPAAAAGVQLGDELLAVDGRQTRQAATLDIVSWVRGPAGTWVKLSLRRAGYVFDLNVQRGRLAY